MIEILFPLLVFANDLPGEELFIAPTTPVVMENPKVSEEPVVLEEVGDSKPKQLKVKKALAQSREASNLPAAYLRPLSRESTISEIVTPPKGSAEIFRAIKVGEQVSARIDHSVIAFPDEKAPVIAIPTSGRFRGMKFIGSSHLEMNSKRVFIDFHRVVVGDQIFELKAVGLSSMGQPGLSGIHHSREAEYFTGEFISSFVAGYFDGLVPRKTNAFGQVEADTSADSAVKKGLASGALASADRFREKLKRIPEFSEIHGPFEIQILILDQAKTNN